MKNERLLALIEEQQKGHENEPLFMVGEQLKEIAEREPAAVELLENDLSNSEMTLGKAAEKLKEYADKNHGKSTCFCITPKVAEKILREFYGIPVTAETGADAKEETDTGYIDLSSFL